MLVDVEIGLYVFYHLDGGSRSFEALFVLFGFFSLGVLVAFFLFDANRGVTSKERVVCTVVVCTVVVFGRSWCGRRRGRGHSGGVSMGDASNGGGGRGRWSALRRLPQRQ